MNKIQQYQKKSIRIIIATLIVYALLVSTHLGEFWPFSIYPMFSQAGQPWERAIVRNMNDISEDAIWKVANHNTLPGKSVPLDELNINANDIANLLSKNKEWNQKKIEGFRKLFSEELESKQLLFMQARGFWSEDDTVKVEFIPFIYLSKDTTLLNDQIIKE